MAQVADIVSVKLNSVLTPTFTLTSDTYTATTPVSVNVVEPVLQPTVTMYPTAFSPVDAGDVV